ncbi:MAG: hypothetical protein U0871_04540 [Gemmataceae bacterium]
MAKRRSAAPVPAAPPPVSKMTLAVPGGAVRLLLDRAAGALLVAIDRPNSAGNADLPTAVQTHLRDNGFTPSPEGDTAWSRPHDAEAGFLDVIDGERVALKAAELIEAAGPTKGRKGRAR